jgi:RNase P/RNase MRP subunit POP5
MEIKIKDLNLKMLTPVLRQKKRYVKIKIKGDNFFDFDFISKNLTNELIYFIGAIDYSNSGIWFLKDKFNFKSQELIIRVSTKLTNKLVSVLNIINKIDNKNIKIEVLKITTTLKKFENNS